MTVAYPLEWPEGWPRTKPEKQLSDNRFNTTFERARLELVAEMRRLGARNLVISSWLPLRGDGYPRADAARRRIEDPGVAIYFELRGRKMSMAQDAFWSVQGNLRSLGLAVAGLRQMERHGGAHMMERAFEGFAALPPPVRKKNWKEVMFGNANVVVTMDIVDTIFISLAKKRHPDAGGTTEAFQDLNEAYEAAKAELGG